MKRRIRSALIRLSLRLLGFLPLAAALSLGAWAGRLAYRLAGRTRRLARAHLELAFPGRSTESGSSATCSRKRGHRQADLGSQARRVRGAVSGRGRRQNPLARGTGHGPGHHPHLPLGKGLGPAHRSGHRRPGVFVPFFGRPAFAPRAAAALAVRFGAPVVVGTIHRNGPRARDGHRLELREIPLSSDPPDREAEVVRLTAACTAALEDAIRATPPNGYGCTSVGGPGRPRGTFSWPLARPMPKTVELSVY
ncbi:MAG TPA: hypothetical protein VFG59_07415 [Anaeromyxobacter sp.]|nr:hypothetical protein [Anaeromyxobacter sp.]